MGLRSRIKGRIKKALGQQDASPEPAPPKPAVAKPAVAKPAVKPAVKPAPVRPAPPPVALSDEEREKQEKAAKHMVRTRKGVLKFVVKQGGTASLADMHKHSEMRFFVGHQKFSQMMEGLIADGLLEYSHADGTGTITEDGRSFIDG